LIAHLFAEHRSVAALAEFSPSCFLGVLSGLAASFFLGSIARLCKFIDGSNYFE
jgi:hypothetical protein